MANSLAKRPDVRKLIADLDDKDENNFDTLSSRSWDGDSFVESTDKALLISVLYGGMQREMWFPLSQLRFDNHRTLYFANWLLRKHGIG